MYSLSDLYKLKDYKVRIVTPDGEYEGILRNFNPRMDRITLERALIMPSRDVLGPLHFFMYEIKSCKIVQKPEDMKKPSSSQNESKVMVSNIVDYRTGKTAALKQNEKVGFFSTRDANEFGDMHDYFEDYDDTNAEAVESEEEEFVLSLPKYFGSKLPIDWVVFDNINDDFMCAIRHINRESVVAVSFEGQSIGRSGELSLIGISTRFCTFLFDIHVLKNEVFEKGLKEVFENPKVQKVIHDCRQASDALFHLYQTNLVNVFDTQVADVFVYLLRSRKGKVGPNVASLSRCIRSHLNFREEDFYPGEPDYRALKEAVDWMRRPINNTMKEVAIKNVILLRELRSVLLELMLSPYTQTVDVYLRVLRNATAKELELLDLYSPDRLPEAILMNGLRAIHCDEFIEPPEFLSSASAFYEKQKSEIFDVDLNNDAKDITAKSNLKISSGPQKNRRPASNCPVRQCDTSLSSEGEVNNGNRKPKLLSQRLHQSINSEGRDGDGDKEVSYAFHPKSVPDNAAIEKISDISGVKLKGCRDPSASSSCDSNARCSQPMANQATVKSKYHLPKSSTASSHSVKEVKLQYMPAGMLMR